MSLLIRALFEEFLPTVTRMNFVTYTTTTQKRTKFLILTTLTVFKLSMQNVIQWNIVKLILLDWFTFSLYQAHFS